jgi:signal transduction histidine kinase
MNLAVIQRHVDGDGASEIVADSIGIVDDAVAEVRTMSYLLHPPMIEQAGLPTALRWYVDGFQQRSGIATTLEVPADLERLPRDVETAVFRIVQEGLTNVQRHSGSSTARITVRRDAERLVVTIGDEGCGLTPAFRENHSALLAAGVGVAGINERVHELGGELTIASSEHGTSLNVALPVAATESAQ